MNIEPLWAAPARVQALTVVRGGELKQIPLPSAPRWLEQVHGKRVVDLDAEPGMPEADAAFTCSAGVVSAIRTADCLPVLLAAADGCVVGAAHAGWRGLAAGVLEETVAAMRARMKPGVAVVAWLGPAISASHFEVGDEVRAAFLAYDAAASEAFTRNERGRWQCDLFLLARQRLNSCGVSEIAGGGMCTYADRSRFYSHRRDVQHEGQSTTGRMVTLIWLELPE